MGEAAEEKLNWMRLASLLIDEGSKCLRRRLLTEINTCHFKDINSALKDSNIEQRIKDLNGIKGPKIIHDTQMILLYPRKRKTPTDINKFDITLCTLLLTDVFKLPPPPSTGNWFQKPDEFDISPGADVVRIRYIRNNTYGHANQLSLTKQEFDTEWMNLESILVRLHGDIRNINKIRTKSFDPKSEKELLVELKSQITTLMAYDFQDVLKLGKRTVHLIEKNHKILSSNLSDVQQNISDLKKMMQATPVQSEFLERKIHETLEKISPQLFTHLLKNIDETLDNLPLEPILSELRELNYKIQEMHENQNTKLQPAFQRGESKEFDDFIGLIEKHTNSFKILLFNEAEKEIDDDTKLEITETLGSLNWDIIIDVDHNSLENGIFDNITKHLKCQKEFFTLRPEDIKSTSDSHKQYISSGTKTLYIFGNGCSEQGRFSKKISTSSRELRGLKVNLIYLITDIITRFTTKKSVLVIILYMSDKCTDMMLKITECLQDVLCTDQGIVDTDTSLAFTILTSDKVSEKDLDHDCSTNSRIWQASPHQAGTLLKSALPSKGETVRYRYPGINGHCYIENTELAVMYGVAHLLHENIGEVNFDGMNQDGIKEKTDDIRNFFLKGNELSLEALYIHDNISHAQVYVVREEMKELLKFIKTTLEKRKSYKEKVHPGYVSIIHESSSGGSTAIRYVAYQLRKEYPCMLVEKNDPKIENFVKKIAKSSKLPVLVILDFDITDREVSVLQKSLDNALAKALVVQLQRRFTLEQTDAACRHELQFVIPSKIRNEIDKYAFAELYKETKKSGIKPNKVFLFGLLHFLGEYVRIQTHVTQVVKNASSKDQFIMRITCLILHYSKEPVKLKLINRILQDNSCDNLYHSSESDEDDKTSDKKLEYTTKLNEDVLERLGIASDLLVVQGEGLKPAHGCITKRLLSQLLGEDKKKQIMTFVDDLKKLFQIDKTESSELLSNILIKTKNLEDDMYFSIFILDVEKICDQKVVIEVLQDIENLVYDHESAIEPHILALHARYLMYKVGEAENAVSIMKKALDCITVKDQILLYIYGNLLRERVKRHPFTKHRTGFKTNLEFLNWAETELTSAIDAYKDSQNHSSSKYTGSSYLKFYNPQAFVGEALAWLLLLKLHFSEMCHENIIAFKEYIPKNKTLNDGLKEALHALDQIEYYESLDKLSNQDISITTSKAISIKLDLLKFHTTEVSLEEQIKSYPLTFSLDVGSLVRRQKDKTSKNWFRKPWKELSTPELKLIIEIISSRFNPTSFRENILLRNNYRDFLLALIYISQPMQGRSANQKYTVPYAIEIASQWVKSQERKNHKDQEAYFLLGVFSLVQGFDEKNKNLIDNAKKSFQECQTICNENKSTDSYRKRQFYIGKGVGLERIIPVSMEFNRDALFKFEGRQLPQRTSHEKRVTINPFKDLSALLHEDDLNSILTSNQEQELEFNLAISKPNLYALNTKQKG